MYLKKIRKKKEVNIKKNKMDPDGANPISIKVKDKFHQALPVPVLQVLIVKVFQVKVAHLILDREQRRTKRGENKEREIIKIEREEQDRLHHLHLRVVAVHLQVHQVLNKNKRKEIKRKV